MLKLIGMSAFILVGALTGIIVNRLFPRNSLGLPLTIAAGIAGAFGGLFIKDLLEFQMIGNFSDSIIFSFISALFLTSIANLLIKR